MALLEVIVRDARAEVVNVVKADVSGEPLENFWEFVKRAALECCGGKIPIVFALPVNTFELVLHVEEPDAGDGCHRDGSELDKEVGKKAEDVNKRSGEEGNGEICGPDRVAITSFRTRSGETLSNKEEEEWGEDEKNEGISHHAVDETLPTGGGKVFLDGHRPDISSSSAVEITGSTMMNGVFPSPVRVGGEGEDTGDEANEVIGAF